MKKSVILFTVLKIVLCLGSPAYKINWISQCQLRQGNILLISFWIHFGQKIQIFFVIAIHFNNLAIYVSLILCTLEW